MRHRTAVQRLIDAFNCQRVEEALSLLHPDVELRPAGVADAVLRGHDGFRRLCAEVERRVPSPQFTVLGLLEAAGTVVMPGRLHPRTRRGPRRLEDEGPAAVGCLSVTMQDGLIVSIEAHFEQDEPARGRRPAPSRLSGETAEAAAPPIHAVTG